MTETIWASIIAVVGTILGSVIGFFGHKWIEVKKAKLDTKQYIGKAQYDLQIEIYKKLSKTFHKVLVIINSVDSQNKEIESIEETKKEYLRLGVALADAQDTLYENAPFIPEEIYKQYDGLNNLINNQFWDYHNRILNENNDQKESSSSKPDSSFSKELIEHIIREINALIRKNLASIRIVVD